jgi:ATP-binding cassette subfamily C (CFTR/MRP) protein 1
LSIAAIHALVSVGLSIPTAKIAPLSTLHYALYLATLIIFIVLGPLNHHTSRQSSTLILIFWPLYLMIAAIRIRTMIYTGTLSRSSESIVVARAAIWLASIVVGLIVFCLELYSPEKRFKKWSWTFWKSDGKIKLDEDEEEEERDGVDSLNGGGVVPGKNEDGDLESPVLTANIYERLTFSWLTRESPGFVP